MQIGSLSHLNINVMLINLNDRQILVYRLRISADVSPTGLNSSAYFIF